MAADKAQTEAAPEQVDETPETGVSQNETPGLFVEALEVERPVEPRAADYDGLRAVLAKLMESQGRDAVLAIFGKYGANNVSSVKPDQVDSMISDAEKALG